MTLVIDLEDSVLRRKRGENEYFSALKADLLPRVTRGPMAQMTRREQKSKYFGGLSVGGSYFSLTTSVGKCCKLGGTTPSFELAPK